MTVRIENGDCRVAEKREERKQVATLHRPQHVRGGMDTGSCRESKIHLQTKSERVVSMISLRNLRSLLMIGVMLENIQQSLTEGSKTGTSSFTELMEGVFLQHA